MKFNQEKIWFSFLHSSFSLRTSRCCCGGERQDKWRSRKSSEVKYLRWKRSRQHRASASFAIATLSFFHVFIQRISRRKFRSAHRAVNSLKDERKRKFDYLPKHFSFLLAKRSIFHPTNDEAKETRTNRKNAFQSSWKLLSYCIAFVPFMCAKCEMCESLGGWKGKKMKSFLSWAHSRVGKCMKEDKSKSEKYFIFKLQN